MKCVPKSLCRPLEKLAQVATVGELYKQVGVMLHCPCLGRAAPPVKNSWGYENSMQGHVPVASR